MCTRTKASIERGTAENVKKEKKKGLGNKDKTIIKTRLAHEVGDNTRKNQDMVKSR